MKCAQKIVMPIIPLFDNSLAGNLNSFGNFLIHHSITINYELPIKKLDS